MTGALSHRLRDGRLHLQHGPIDLIVELFGHPREVERGYGQAADRFPAILPGLVSELHLLRTPVRTAASEPRGDVARCMVEAVWPHRGVFVTPMAAVAGAVADAVMHAAWRGRRLAKGYVNNGGDIAFALAPGARFEAGIVDRVDRPAVNSKVSIRASESPRGMATSGWRGRSLSLGIADAVTVLAATAATADVAATLIANTVTVEDAAIERRPACQLDPDSDLGEIPVTVAVGSLSRQATHRALSAGLGTAQDMLDRGLISAAYVSVGGQVGTVGAMALGAAEQCEDVAL